MIFTLTTRQLIRGLSRVKNSEIVNECTSIVCEEAIVCVKQCDAIARVLNMEWDADSKVQSIEKIMFDDAYWSDEE